MDGFVVKSEFIGFKVDPWLKEQLKATAKAEGFNSLGKFLCYVCMMYLRSKTFSGGGVNV